MYYEYLSLGKFLLILYKKITSRINNNLNNHTYFYIDISGFSFIVIRLLKKIMRLEVNRLDFELRNIKDDNGELIRLRIPRSDLFIIQENIINSDLFKSLYNEGWSQETFIPYLKKGIVPVDRNHPNSGFKMLFIIQVIVWHMKKHEITQGTLFVTYRAWFDIYAQYALDNGIELKSMKKSIINKFNKANVVNILRKYPKVLINIKNFNKSTTNTDTIDPKTPKIYQEGRGDTNLKNNGYHSDLFWYLNSSFPGKNILFKVLTNNEEIDFKKHGVNVINNDKVNFSKSIIKIPYPIKNNSYKYEQRLLKTIVDSYNYTKSYWINFFQLHNVKIFLTWYKYDNTHMAIADAIRSCDGIAIVNQFAFDGTAAFECNVSTDVIFGFSNFSFGIEKTVHSQVPYFVITGYPKDYAGSILKTEAHKLRKGLRSNGAEKIVFVIDENSGDDARWHTGHPLQRENYRFILEKVLETPWLGVVFKPKVSRTLIQRLGSVAELLIEAEKTGRCFMYKDSGHHTTSAPPLLAGLSADVCIHSHLSAGTAALECALQGVPTLLIDREGTPFSKLNDLPQGKVVFKNWPDTIDAVMEHFQSDRGIPGFGVWDEEFLREMDPFRDGKAANRMGTYLHWLIQGFEEKLDRETIMAQTADRYAKKWGSDKVLSIGV